MEEKRKHKDLTIDEWIFARDTRYKVFRQAKEEEKDLREREVSNKAFNEYMQILNKNNIYLEEKQAKLFFNSHKIKYIKHYCSSLNKMLDKKRKNY